MSGTLLFFEAIPRPQPDADLIARVSLSEVNEDMGRARATVIEVLKASDARIHQGDKIAMKYQATSCGPDQKSGDSGKIIARIGADIKGHLVLYPYMHDHRNRINPP